MEVRQHTHTPRKKWTHYFWEFLMLFIGFIIHSSKTKTMTRNVFLAVLFIFFQVSAVGQASYFYPGAGNFNASIPTPEKFLGYAIGSHHTRHDKLVEYFKELDRLSDRVSFQVIGETFEHRPQVIAIFTSPSNHQRLEEIRKAHLAGQVNGNTENIPW